MYLGENFGMLGDASPAQLAEERNASQNVANLNAAIAQLQRQNATGTPAYTDLLFERDVAVQKVNAIRARNQALDSQVGVRERIGDVQTVIGNGLQVAGTAAKKVADNITWMLPLVAISGLVILGAIYLPKPSQRKGNG